MSSKQLKKVKQTNYIWASWFWRIISGLIIIHLMYTIAFKEIWRGEDITNDIKSISHYFSIVFFPAAKEFVLKLKWFKN